MASVTNRINSIKQPKGGYLTSKDFTVIPLDMNFELSLNENIHASLIGTAVDYMTRFLNGKSLEDSFHYSLLGAKKLNMEEKAYSLLKNIKGTDDLSISSACKLVGFDVTFRRNPDFYRAPAHTINADIETLNNIRIMIDRSMSFFKKYGPVTLDGFTFEYDGYTSTINSGVVDYLTKDTRCVFKVSKNKPTSNNRLQILIYYLMGQVSNNKEYFETT